MRFNTWILTSRIALCGVLVFAGCNHSSKGGGRTLNGSLPTVNQANAGASQLALLGDGGPVSLGPTVELITPVRGTFASAGPIQIQGVASDAGNGVARVVVDGVDAPVDATGVFQAQVTAVPGMNTWLIQAYDHAGELTEKHVSVLAGDFGDELASLPDAATVRITDNAINQFEPELAAELIKQRDQIRQQVLASPVPDIQLTDFRFGDVTIALDAASGGMRFLARIQDVELDITASARILLVIKKDFKGTIRAGVMEITGDIAFGVQGDQASGQVLQTSATASGFSVPDFARSQTGQILDSFETAFADAARTNLEQMLQKALVAQNRRGTLSQDIAGKALTIDWLLNTLAFDEDGVTAAFDGNVMAETPIYGSHTGSFVVGGLAPSLVGGGPGPNLALSFHQDALNRALHAAWRAGALQHDLDQAAFDKAGVRTNMTTSGLMQAVPELNDYLVPDLPLVMRIEGMLPPLLTIDPRSPQLFDLDIADLRVQLDVIHPTEGAITLINAVFTIEASANLGPGEDNGFVLEPTGTPTIRVDVDGRALPGSETMLEKMINAMAPQLFEGSLSQVKLVAIPTVRGVDMVGVNLSKYESSIVVL
ncbi:MAG: hypothetical protein KDD82_15625, partial [Planctomycetes bacterium]|nr:hypothetical protein [Planctomycetota bacterium]